MIAYDDYQIFLDKELNNAYGILMKHLPDAQKKELKQSQRNWIKFRDAEFRLIKV
ncbi:MAG: lysozyme inhibitor LprI family protein [Candidatus Thiodiazotropha sp.]